MIANFSSSKGLLRSNTPPFPPAFAVGLNMYSSSSFSVALKTKKLFFELCLSKPGEEEDDVEEEEEAEEEIRPATTVADAASVNILVV